MFVLFSVYSSLYDTIPEFLVICVSRLVERLLIKHCFQSDEQELFGSGRKVGGFKSFWAHCFIFSARSFWIFCFPPGVCASFL